MALGAMAKYPDLDVKIVPCGKPQSISPIVYSSLSSSSSFLKGLNYFHAHRFRSRAVIEFGTPISINRDMVQKYRNGGPEKREACGKLLETIYDALKSVTVNAGSYETLMVIKEKEHSGG